MPLTNKKKMAIVLAIVITLTGVVGYRIYQNIAASKARAGNMQAKAATVQVAQVGRQDIIPKVEYSGSLEPVWSADVSAKVDGRVNTLTVSEGDLVKKGTVIATLDTSELSAQVLQAQGNLIAAQSGLEQAELDYNRYTVLAEKGAIAAQMLDGARTKRDLSLGQVRAAEGSLALVQEKLNNANVLAPREGVVTKRYLQAGAYTRAGSAIVTVADVSSLLAKATVGEAQVTDLAVGTPVKVTINALNGQEFTGTVARVSPVAALPARTFTAEIIVPNESGMLKAGMFAKVELATRIHPKVITVPESALVMREDQKTVFVVSADNKIQQRLIKPGYIGDGLVEVLEGLTDGETIVVDGQNKVKDGAAVSPVKDGGN
ncbi:efflux RND transporter periplasmic adaptor subunit [Anaerospora sp.]|uniref:efflux RND transporter periplasmic adaptor subunit n=1 Tax=Anaerospora sp. TaxID=1960278 RepID=UPI00289BE8C9|nr:efflux RND transporter periplasmic adaptor subunit [Anaerospora sp.]